MRHQKSGRALGVSPSHRKAMLRNMVTSLIEHEQIRTTVTRAKELRKPLDKMITLGKKGDLSSRRLALGFIKSKKAMAALFGELAERYADRPGGFSRIMRVGPRKGDGAEIAIIQLVGGPNDPFAEAQQPKRKRGQAKPKKVSEAVVEEVKAQSEASAAEMEEAAEEKKAKPKAAETEEATEEVESKPIAAAKVAETEEATEEVESKPIAAAKVAETEEATEGEINKEGETPEAIAKKTDDKSEAEEEK